MVIGVNFVIGVILVGKCVCYYGYSGLKCVMKSMFSFIYVYNVGGLKN